MKRNLLRAFALLLMAVILTTAFVCNATYAKAEGEPFTVTGSDGAAVGSYATWATAVASAAKGCTITMNDNYTEDVDVIIPNGVTLDLNGYTLSVKSVIGVNGSHLIDGSANKTGLLETTGKVELNPDNASLPVWKGTGYMLLQPKMTSSYQKFVRQTDGKYYFAFRPGFGYVNGESVANTYLADENINSGLQMQFTVLTKEDGYSAADDGLSRSAYYFDAVELKVDDVFQYVYGNNKMFFCRLNGAEDLSQLRIKTTIYSVDTGVKYTSESMTGKATLLDLDRATGIDDNGYIDTIKANTVDSNKVSFADGTLHQETAVLTDQNYDEFLSAATIFVDVKFSNITLSSGSGDMDLRYQSAGSATRLLRIRRSGSVGSTAGFATTLTLQEGTTDNYGDLELTIALDTATGSIKVWNKTTGTVSDHPLTGNSVAPVDSTYFGIYTNANTSVDIVDLKVYTDANTTFGDLVSDIKVDKEVSLTLDDKGNADGLRPAKVMLQAINGETVVKEMEVNAIDGTYTFTGLPKYKDDGVTEIDYTFTAAAEHYVPSVDGTAITLKHTPFSVTYYYNNDFTATVTAGDGNTEILDASGYSITDNNDKLATATVDGDNCVELKTEAAKAIVITKNLTAPYCVSFRVRLAKGVTSIGDNLRIRSDTGWFAYFHGTQLGIQDGNNFDLSDEAWTDVFFKLETGKLTYQIGGAEPVTIEGFADGINRFQLYNNTTTAVSGLYIDDLQIYAPYDSATVAGSINWEDFDDADKLRPKELTMNLYNGDFLWKTATVSEASGWAYSFTDLPITNATEGIVNPTYEYSVELASVPDGYVKETNGYNFTLTHTPTEKDVTVTLTLDDGNNADGLRPAKVMLQAINSQTQAVVKEMEVDAANGTYTFENLPIFDAEGNEITYEFTAEVEHYWPSVDGTAITLTHTPVVLTYYYNNDFNGLTQEVGDEVTNIKDSAGKIFTDTQDKFVTHTDGDNTYIELTGDAGTKYQIGAVSHGADSYFVSFRVRLTESVTNLRIRPNKSEYFAAFHGNGILINDGNATTFTLSADEWTNVFFSISNGSVTYQIGDAAPATFTVTYVNGVNRFEIYNQGAEAVSGLYIDDLQIYTYDSVDVTGAITWSDLNNLDGSRPESVTVNLYNGSFLKDTAVVTADAEGNWKYSFKYLPKTNATEGIVNPTYEYSVELASVPDGYTKETNGNSFTLIHTPVNEQNVTVTLTLDDGNNADGLRPDTITLQALNGENVVKEIEVTATSGEYTFENLPVFDENNNKITYSYTAEVEHYMPSVDGTAITLTHTPVVLTYYYNNDFNGLTQEVGDEVTNIKDSAGKIFTDTQDKFVTHTDGDNTYIELTGDAGSKYQIGAVSHGADSYFVSFRVRLTESVTNLRIRPNKSEYFAAFHGNGILINDGNATTFTLSADEWTNVFFSIGNGSVTYQIGDASPATFTFSYTNGVNRFEIYNQGAEAVSGLYIDDLQIYTYDSVDVTGEITWSGIDDLPESVTVNLYNGSFLKDTAVVTVDAEGNWKYSFKYLPKTNATEGIVNPTYEYRVEIAGLPEDYTAVPDGNGNFEVQANFS